MNIKTFTTGLTLSALAALGVLGTAALPAGALASASADGDPVPRVTVHKDKGKGVDGFRIAHDINKIRVKHQEDFVKKAVDVTWKGSGRRYNVVIQNLSNDYDERLTGTKFYANVNFNHVRYGIWVSEGGSFTNKGRGGYDNWGYKGWWKRSGKNVKFHRP